MGIEDYKEEIQGVFRRSVEQTENPLSAAEIAHYLIENFQFGEGEYVSSPEDLGCKVVRIPDQSGVQLPGKANAVEEFFRGKPEQLLVQRLLVTEKKAREIIEILKNRNFEISP